jgi:hypothetical protein
MAEISKILDDLLLKFYSLCVSYEHQIFFTTWMKNAGMRTIDEYSKYIEATPGNNTNMGTYTASSILDVFSDKDFPVYARIGNELSTGERVNQLTEEINLKLNGLLLCSLHEAWENYVKGTLAISLFVLKDTVIMKQLPKYDKFDHCAKKKRKQFHKTLLYFQEYVDFICRQNCTDAYELFKKYLDFSLIKKRKYHVFDSEWFEICKALALVRNSIVHADGRMNADRLKRLDAQMAKIIRANLIRKSEITKDERLLVPDAIAGYFIEAMATHAYTIYVLVTKEAMLPRQFNFFAH